MWKNAEKRRTECGILVARPSDPIVLRHEVARRFVLESAATQDHPNRDLNTVFVQHHCLAGLDGDDHPEQQSCAHRKHGPDQWRYASAATTLSNGSTSIDLPAGSLATGSSPAPSPPVPGAVDHLAAGIQLGRNKIAIQLGIERLQGRRDEKMVINSAS